jgi:hypothetical protein
MSIEHIIELDDHRTFESTHRFESLEIFHVPFDELTGNMQTEAALTRLASRGARVPVIGPMGSGKSSVMSFVLGPLADRLAESVVPLRIPVGGEPDDTVREPRAFVQHVIAMVVRWASPEMLTEAEREQAERGITELRTRRGAERVRRFNLKTPGWIADAGFSREVKTTGEDIQTRLSTGDIIEEARRLVQIFRAHGREPFFVFDDSDAWVRVAGDDSHATAESFFRENVSLFARELDCGFVTAVHDEYLTLEGYRHAERLLDPAISIPVLDDPADAVRAILQRRIEAAGFAIELGDVVDRDAMLSLESHYDTARNLRDTIRAAAAALGHARDDGSPLVSRAHMRKALAEQRR